MRNILLVLLILALFTSCKVENNTLLIEAENFEEKGGWLVDPQFVEQVGSPYLLAHGLGEPGQMGVAVGYAASLCTEHKASPWDILLSACETGLGKIKKGGHF